MIRAPASAYPGQVGCRLDMGQQLHPGAEEAGAERDDTASLDALWILAEEVEIEAEVEDAEVLLVVAGTEQFRTESRAASDHLPELDLRVDRLEEDQVRYLGNVDAGVEHVDRDGNVRRVVLL